MFDVDFFVLRKVVFDNPAGQLTGSGKRAKRRR